MALPFLALAYPVLHSSGAWIAYAGGGYLAGTLSSTWIGAFILGNAGVLSAAGLVSSAGIAGALGLFSSIGSGTALLAGKALAMVGLGGVASSMGVAPAAAAFLGLTPIGWAVAGTLTAIGATLGYYFSRSFMATVNAERGKGGLSPTTPGEIIREIKDYEKAAQDTLYNRLAKEFDHVLFDRERRTLSVGPDTYTVSRLRYVINADGSEFLIYSPRFGKARVILVVKPSERSK